jgi:hypothetical protein
MAVSMMDPELMSRTILVDFATEDIHNATTAANKMKEIKAIFAGLPLSQVENQIVQLHKHIVIHTAHLREAQG